MELTHTVTIDYSNDCEMLQNEGWSRDKCAKHFTKLFEASLAKELKGGIQEDEGGVIVYSKRIDVGHAIGWKQAYWFDYENMCGGRYE